MQVGNLRHRVLFQSKLKIAGNKTASGADIYSWTTVYTRSASIKPLKGREFIEARGVFSENMVSIMVRYDSETALITNEWRILTKDDSPQEIYAIKAILNDRKRDRWLEFWCTEGAEDLH